MEGPQPRRRPGTAAALDAAFAAARQEPNLTSLVVSQGGAIVRQEYFNGTGPDTTQNVWSVTKSVLSLTVGIALDQGCLRSLDQTLGELLDPSVTGDPQKAAITLRHLLTMSSGLDFPEMSTYTSSPSIYSQWINAPDQVAWVMARPLTAAPGQRFEYGSGTIHLASVALSRACGTSTSGVRRRRALRAARHPRPRRGRRTTRATTTAAPASSWRRATCWRSGRWC